MKYGKLLWSRIGKILFPFICQLESDSHYVWKEEQLADSTCSVSSNCKILDSENAYLPSFDLKTTKRQLFQIGTTKSCYFVSVYTKVRSHWQNLVKFYRQNVSIVNSVAMDEEQLTQESLLN